MRRLLLARCALALAAGCAGAGLAAPAWAQAADESAMLERRVKAAFLFKFADYVEWPEGAFARANPVVTIAVAGDELLASELAQAAAAQRSAEGRQMAVRRLREGEGAAGAQVLFVGRAEAPRLPQIVRSASGPVLIVTETDGALAQGSIINFVMTAGRVRFEVALDNAERRGLRLSARLLTVAQYVRTAAP